MSDLLEICGLSCGYGDRPVLDGVNLTVWDVACHEHYMVHARLGMRGRTFRRKKSVFFTLQNISDIYRTSGGGVNGVLGEMPRPIGCGIH